MQERNARQRKTSITHPPVPVAGRNTTNDNQTSSRYPANHDGEESVNIVSTPKIEAESKKDLWDKALVPATGALVIIGTFQIIFLWRTVKATKDNAEAALLNAKALINAERVWLVVTWASDKKILGLFKFGCRNQGKTPAKIISISAKVDFVKNLDLAIPPDYSTPTTMPDLQLVVRSDSFRIGKGINPESILLRNGEKKLLVNQSREFLIYYGNIVYQDTLREDGATEGKHETRWCFVYIPNEEGRFDHNIPSRPVKFTRSGPNEYNSYT